MGKRIIHDGPVNQAVMAWMRGQNINPNDVRGYTLKYDAGDPMMIEIRMYMEDVAPVVEPSSWPKRVRDIDDDTFVLIDAEGTYRMVLDETGGLGENRYTLEEIGQHEVIEE